LAGNLGASMIFVVLILVVIGVGVGVAFMMKSKGASADDGMMSVPPRPAAAEPPSETLSERLEQHTNVTAVPRSPVEESLVAPQPEPEPVEPRELTPFEAAPDLSLRSESPLDDAATAPEPMVPEPVAAVEEAPEPLVRARVQPAPAPAPSAPRPVDEDDDEAVVSRLRVPGQRPVKVVEPSPAPATPEPAAAAFPTAEVEEPTVLPSFLETAPAPATPVPPGIEAEAAAFDEEPSPEPELEAVAELEPEVLPEPAQSAVAADLLDAPEAIDLAAADATAAVQTAPIELETDVDVVDGPVDEPIAVFDVSAETEPVDDATAGGATTPATTSDETAGEPDVFTALYEAQISGDMGGLEPTAATPDEDVAPPVAERAAVASEDEIEPEVSTGTTPPPVQFVLEPEPEADPVDHILKALVNRAKAQQVGIAEVAAELVEQANLEDRDIDEVLADLVERVDEDEEQVNPAARLEELTFFNESVPRRPGQITDYDRLDKAAKKKVIIRVLCLLVAMQEDNRLKPSDPRSEAETRHWPLARAVWPVPIGASAEAEAAAAEGAEDGADGEKKLPGRRLMRTKR